MKQSTDSGRGVVDATLHLRYSMQNDQNSPLRNKLKGSAAASENFNDIEEDKKGKVYDNIQSFRHRHTPSLNDLIKQKFTQPLIEKRNKEKKQKSSFLS